MGNIVKDFNQWLAEKKSVDDTETEGDDIKDDGKLEDEQDDYLQKKDNKCPRCGERYPCDCQDKDSMDTNTSGRFKGKKKEK